MDEQDVWAKALRRFLGVAWPGSLITISLCFCWQVLFAAGSPDLGLPDYFWLLLLSVAFIPVANMWAASAEDAEDSWLWVASLANGYTLAASAAWCVLFGPMMFFCLLSPLPWVVLVLYVALAPVAALLGTILASCAIAGRVSRENFWKVQGAAAAGLLSGLIVLLGPDVSGAFHDGLVFSAKHAESASERRSAVRLLRAFGSESDLLRGCYGQVQHLLPIHRNPPTVDSNDYRDVFYRVTGKSFSKQKPPFTVPVWSGDIDRAGEVVGGKAPVVLDASIFDCKRNGEQSVTLNWELRLANTSLTPQEARAQIKLPEGSVVSDAVLFINGVPKSAALCDRSRARAAYQDVVMVRRRDPLLVSWQGPDRVMMQCFPVPPRGTGEDMVLRLKIECPFVAESESRWHVRLPQIVEANFDKRRPETHVDKSMYEVRSNNFEELWLDRPMKSKPGGPVSSSARTAKNLFVVVDGGKELAVRRAEIADALNRLHQLANTRVYFASDEISALTDDGAPPNAATAAAELRYAPFTGGPDNMEALSRAIADCPRVQDSVLVWLHGPQPKSAKRLKEAWPDPFMPIYEIAVVPGSFDCAESFEGLNLRSFERSMQPLSTTLEQLVATDFEDNGRLRGITPAIAAAREVFDHCRFGRLTIASDLAHSAHIVSPVTSAVVLENESQYLNYGIETPEHHQLASANSAPTNVIAGIAGAQNSVVNQLNALNSYSATPNVSTTNNMGSAQPQQETGDNSLLWIVLLAGLGCALVFVVGRRIKKAC